MALLIKNVKIVNADKETNEPQDVLTDKGLIVKIGNNLSAGGAKVLDGQGMFVMPGLIDLHVHLREPGREDKETIETGCQAAARGGFTTIMCMPNTNPVIDNAMVVEGILKEAKRVGLTHVIPVGAMTKDLGEDALTDMFELKQAGCLALSNDGRCVNNAGLMRLALEYAQMVGLLLIQHCQDPLLTRGGVMNEGLLSTILGIKADPGISETVILARDIELSHYLKTKMHFAHLSLKRSVELVRQAKQQGLQVSCEVTPHHFSLTDEAVRDFNPNAKVNPPLRTQEDIAAIKKGLKDGTIDCIACDHAPHTKEDKEVGFDDAPFGMIGLETSLGLALTELVHKDVLTLSQLVEKMSINPAKIVGLDKRGVIEEGYEADLTLVDPDEEWTVRAEDFASKSQNSPFIGRKLKGVVQNTILGGKIVYQRKKSS